MTGAFSSESDMVFQWCCGAPRHRQARSSLAPVFAAGAFSRHDLKPARHNKSPSQVGVRPGLSRLFAASTPNPLRGASLFRPNAERESIGYAQGGTREGIDLALQLL